ncbi:TetR/AcrR family transcriptional regulator [Staphylococcus caprae]|uniref:TetR/AcrR family transcriptional regulator n=1 Tax=Staphylococcus caprae TaxID=29380 RepID=UPI001C11D62D|nr:TetR/AcrR family transcriptional regulator [Staphylococcus caprae]MBU5271996.1 TetR/AcrR family transcriptional regulator [Staphylococcus caprae]
MRERDIRDIRVTKTQNRIRNGMMRLLKIKTYDTITVKDICKESQISRTTFYSHYNDKEHFIYSHLNELLKKGKRELLKEEFSSQTYFFENAIKFWSTSGSLILILLGDNSAHKLHQEIKKVLQKNIEINIVPILNTKLLTTKEKYFLLIFISNAIFGVIQDWVNRGCIEKPNELATIMNKIITSAFK